MKKNISLLSGLLFAATLTWGAPPVLGQETEEPLEAMIFRIANEDGSYCHLKFPLMSEASLGWGRPVFQSDSGMVDFYGPCNYDPLGQEEITAQRRVIDRGYYDDGE